MRTHPVIWAWFRFRPQIGWLPLFLLVAIVSCLASAVLEVGWVPEDGVIIPTVTFGLLLSTFLGQRRLSWLPAWLLITAYGLLITILDLAQLWLPFPQIFQGWEPTRQVWLQNGALFLDRMGSWFRAASTNGTSRETIVFAFGLGLVAYFLVAYVGWATFRRRRPLPGLATMGVVLAINGYYGTAQIWWTGIFVGLMALMTAVMHYAQLEQTWETNRVDYSTEVRTDLLVYAGAIALILFMMALALPAFSITKLRQAFARQTAVQEVEDVLERVFAGVVQPRQIDAEVIPERARGGVMPRDYLLGNAPELQETVMMTAVVTIESPGGASILAPPELLYGKHWRALSYDIYTGRGWAISSERKEPIPANTAIQLPAMDKQITATQRVHWLRDNRLVRYTMGLPVRFDQEITVSWRGLTDLSRVQGEDEPIYLAQSRLTVVTPADLRQTAVADVPAAILARYTELPDSIPERVHDLAREVAGDFPNPYDQARALERFLRQYPYSLDVTLPPSGADPVDYFLFELQAGYCDYYASSMVVMARSLGLPARLVIGFLAQPPDEAGVQTVRHINGHSWAEIYFADYGWIEFEPTASFNSPFENPFSTGFILDPSDFIDDPMLQSGDLPTIPEPSPDMTPFPWGRVGLVAALVLPLYWLWRRQQKGAVGRDYVLWAFGRVQHSAQKLGQPTRPSQTPLEFTTTFLRYLETFIGQRPFMQRRLTDILQTIRPAVEQLTTLFIQRQYAGMKQYGELSAHQLWRRLRRPLWFLRFLNLFRK